MALMKSAAKKNRPFIVQFDDVIFVFSGCSGLGLWMELLLFGGGVSLSAMIEK